MSWIDEFNQPEYDHESDYAISFRYTEKERFARLAGHCPCSAHGPMCRNCLQDVRAEMEILAAVPFPTVYEIVGEEVYIADEGLAERVANALKVYGPRGYVPDHILRARHNARFERDFERDGAVTKSAAMLPPYAPGYYVYGWKPEGTVRHALVVLGPFDTADAGAREAETQGLGPSDDFPITVIYRPDPHLPRVEDL